MHRHDCPALPLLQGLSMGGMIATALAAEGGGRVGKVVLAPGTAGSPQSGMRDMELWQRMLAGNITFLDFVGGIFPLDTPEGVAQGWLAEGIKARLYACPKWPASAGRTLACAASIASPLPSCIILPQGWRPCASTGWTRRAGLWTPIRPAGLGVTWRPLKTL